MFLTNRGRPFVALLATLSVVWVVGFAMPASAILVGGKYHRPTLSSQNVFCLGGICDRCMSDRWPDLLNVFDTRNGSNCNGIFPPPFVATNRILGWGNGDWAWFLIIGSPRTLQETVDYCQENFDEIHCAFATPNGPVPVPGAYYVGSEYSLNDLDQMIDRTTIGWRAFDPVPFEPLRSYVDDAAFELGYDDQRGWRAIYRGAARYVVELELGQGPPPAVVGGQVVSVRHAAGAQADINFGLKVLIHALVACETWEDTARDILGPYGILPFCDAQNDDCAPSFVYEIWMAFQDIVHPYVKTEETTWGLLKGEYR